MAVAELGEVAPPPLLVERFQKESRLFRRVEGIPGMADGDYASDPYSSERPCPPGAAEAARATPRQAMQRMQRLSRDAGMDYLLLFGATVDSDSHRTGAALADLTIVGAYLMPSRHISGRARASAVLVDLRTNRVVLSAGTEANDTRHASAVGREGSQSHQIEQLRDKAFAELGDRVIEQITRRASAAGVAAAPRPEVPTDPFAAPVAAPVAAKASEAMPQLLSRPPEVRPDGPLPPDPVPGKSR